MTDVKNVVKSNSWLANRKLKILSWGAEIKSKKKLKLRSVIIY